MKISQYEANTVNLITHLTKCNGDIFLITTKLIDTMIIDNRSYSKECYIKIVKYCNLLSNIVHDILFHVINLNEEINDTILQKIINTSLDVYKRIIISENDIILQKSFSFLYSSVPYCTTDKTPIDLITEFKYCIINSLKLYTYSIRSIDSISNGYMTFYLNGSLLNYSTYEELLDIIIHIIDKYKIIHIAFKSNTMNPLSKDLLELLIINLSKKRSYCNVTC